MTKPKKQKEKLRFTFIVNESSANPDEPLQCIIDTVPFDFEPETDGLMELREYPCQKFMDATQRYFVAERGAATLDDTKNFIMEVNKFISAMQSNPDSFGAGTGKSAEEK